MKTRKRIITILMMICLIFEGMLSYSCALTGFKTKALRNGKLVYHDDPDDPESSFVYKNYLTPKVYNAALRRKMKDVYKNLSGDINNKTTMPIPGIVNTYVASGDEFVACDRFVPQGVCDAGEYRLVTAYDSDKKLDSVIYVIDKKSAELISTLTLPHHYHVGGIAFDGNNIWLPGNTSNAYEGKPFVQYIRYEDFLKMIENSLYDVPKKKLSRRIYIKNTPSFLTCDEGRLWVGTYVAGKQSKEGYANGYEIINDGKKTSLNAIVYKTITGIDSSAQGMDIDGNYLYVSSSYAGGIGLIKSSFVTKYDISPLKKKTNAKNSLYVGKRELSRFEVPKMIEELLIDGDQICMNFEAGAKKYKSAVINTDRLLSVDKKVWGID